MPSYLIKHKATGERRGPVYASCADEACNLQGWELAACEAEELNSPGNGKPPFVLTEDERDLIQHYIDLEGVGLSIPEMIACIIILRRWMDSQD